MDSENSLISFQLILFNEKKEQTYYYYYYPYFKKATYIYKTYNVYVFIVYFCALLWLRPLSWSSCTHWASAPERIVSASCPGTSGTCSRPAAIWFDSHRKKGPPLLTATDECDICFIFLMHKWFPLAQDTSKCTQNGRVDLC